MPAAVERARLFRPAATGPRSSHGRITAGERVGKELSLDAIVLTRDGPNMAGLPLMAGPLRVLMADDHPIVLAGMKALVAADPELNIVGEARDGRTALQLAKDLRPDAAVLDIGMPGLNGLEVALALRTEAPEIRVIILTVHEDRAYLRQLLEAGVSAYLLKRSAAEELVRAIHAVAEGGLYLDPAIAGKVVGAAARSTPNSPLGAPPNSASAKPRCFGCWPRAIPARKSPRACRSA